MSLRNKEVIRVMALMKRKVWVYLGALILDAITDSFCYNIAIAFIMKDMLNAIVKHNKDLFLRGMFLGLVTLAAGFFLVPVFKYLWNKISSETIVDIKKDMFMHLSKLPITYYEKHHSGEIITLVTNNVSKIEALYNENLMMIIFAIVHGSLAIGSMFLLDYKIAVIILPLGFLSILINKKFVNPIRSLSKGIQQKYSLKNKQLTNILASNKVSKMFDLDKGLYEEYADINDEMSLLTMKRVKISGIMDALNFVYDKFRYVIIILIGIILVVKGFTSIGVIVAMVSLQTYASYMFTNIGNFITNVQDSLVGADKIFDLLSEDKEDVEGVHNSMNIKDNKVALEMKGVSFEYEEGKKVFSNLNLSIKNGQKIALVGPSGSGKSTLSKLFLNLYPIKSGEIYVYGNNIKNIKINDIRKTISYVSQDPYLFNGTIEDNLRCGNLDCTMEEIIEAAKASRAYDFIMQQPNKFQTVVGEKAVNLSGGEKQRLSIARALLKNSPIIILDEATSSLDSKTEEELKEAINQLVRNKTVLKITHRLTSIDKSDFIYVLDRGNIVEMGDYIQLTSKNGFYKKFSEAQLTEAAI